MIPVTSFSSISSRCLPSMMIVHGISDGLLPSNTLTYSTIIFWYSEIASFWTDSMTDLSFALHLMNIYPSISLIKPCTNRSLRRVLYAAASPFICYLISAIVSFLSISTYSLTFLIFSILNWFYCLDFSIFILTNSLSNYVSILVSIFFLSSIIWLFFWIVNSSSIVFLILSTSSRPCYLMN